MVARNEITGDKIQTRDVLSKEGEEAFDRIFGVKKKEKYIPPPLPLNEYPDNGPVTEEWDEKRIDVISQNGNEGLHY